MMRVDPTRSAPAPERNDQAPSRHRVHGPLADLRARAYTSGLWTRLRGDFFGGAIAALIAVPYGMALSIAMGMRPEAGLYTSIIGGIVSGALSYSPVLISGLSATAVPILAVVVKEHGVGAALMTGFLCGLIMFLIGALKLGRFANYLPQSIVSAFTSGLGLTIIASQLKTLFGVTPKPLGFDLGVVDDIGAMAVAMGASNPQTLITGGIVLAAIVLLPRWKESLPAPILGVLLATLIAKLLGFEIPRVGELPSSLPLPRLFDFKLAMLSELMHPALTLAGLFTINQVLTAVVVNRVTGSERGEKCSRELIAQGAANLLTPFFGAPPGVAMLARTVASARAGAMSRLSVVAHSFILILFILPLRGLISQIPLAALAAVTVAVGFQLTDYRRFLALRRMARADAALFLLTFLLVVLSDLVTGVGIGFLIAMVLFIERAAESTHLEAVATSVSDENPGADSMMQAFRLVGPLFFATSERLHSQLRSEVTSGLLALDLSAAGPADTSAVDLMRRVYAMQRERGGDLFLTGVDRRLYELFEKNGLVEELGASRFMLKTSTVEK